MREGKHVGRGGAAGACTVMHAHADGGSGDRSPHGESWRTGRSNGRRSDTPISSGSSARTSGAGRHLEHVAGRQSLKFESNLV